MNLEQWFVPTIRFGKQSPGILRRQNLVAALHDEVLDIHSQHNIDHNYCRDKLPPSIERFYCSLLFVDISGFTKLSQELALDDLKSNINAYFDRMLDIILKNDGEVVKFAGDALFVLWQEGLYDGKDVLVKAVNCAREIQSSCSNYKICVDSSDSKISSKLKLTIPKDESSHQNGSAVKANMKQEYVLDVRLGISAGIMAGLDVGYNDRWEYFIIGDALQEVAKAESDAQRGDIVMSPASHAILHGNITDVTEESPDTKSSPSANLPPCDCTLTPCGYFKLSSSPYTTEILTPRTLQSHSYEKDVLNDRMMKAIEDSRNFVDYETILSEIITTQKYIYNKFSTSLRFPFQRDEAIFKDLFFDAYLDYCQQMLLKQLLRHAHEVDRAHCRINLNEVVTTCTLTSLWASISNTISATSSNQTKCSDDQRCSPSSPKYNDMSPRTRRRSSSSCSISVVSKIRGTTKFCRQHSMGADILGAELRRVTVLFLNLHMKPFHLVKDENPENPKIKSSEVSALFSFLPRTEMEYLADKQLLEKYQTCVSIIINELHQKGGQLRQFIVDDKGTVCIGTFGLRGSIHADDAALGVEAAQQIVTKLRSQVDVPVSVGIATGKVYCGFVGSHRRHEYAVMGPSVNLSARLMGLAGVGQIICDEQTRKLDRTHRFTFLKDVHAKGYEDPVPTFLPLYEDRASESYVDLTSLHQARRNSLSTGQGNIFGMSEEFRASLHFAMTFSPQVCDAKIDSMKIIQAIEKKSFDSELLETLNANDISALFATDSPCRLVVISGVSGTGKSSLLQLLCSGLDTHSAAVCGWFNVVALSSRCNNLSAREPFLVWKPILKRIIPKFLLYTTSSSSSSSFLPNASSNSTIDILLSHLPPDLQALRPLLFRLGLFRSGFGSGSGSGREETDSSAKLAGDERIKAKVRLIAGILQSFVRVSGKMLLILIDDVQAMDEASLQLLQHLWGHVQGVSILCSHHNDSSSSRYDKFSDLENAKERVMHLEIGALDLYNTTLMAKDIFERYAVPSPPSEVFAQIFKLSGGNPLHVHELVNLAGRTFTIESNGVTGTRQSISTIIRHLRPQRIEEVVTCSFDQFDDLTRSVLKMASVAAYVGRTFDLSIILYMASESAAPSPSTSVHAMSSDSMCRQVLRTLLKSGDFIQLAMSSSPQDEAERTSGSPVSGTTVPPDFAVGGYDSDQGEEGKGEAAPPVNLDDVEMEFCTTIEQNTIYELMIDEQRTSLHHLVAVYLESRTATEQSYFLYNELALHYQLSKVYYKSLEWHYQAALHLDSSGAFRESKQNLVESFAMYDMMRRETGLSVSDGNLAAYFPLPSGLLSHSPSKESLLLRSLTTERPFENTASGAGGTESAIFTPTELSLLFRGDAELLVLVAKMLVKLGQICLSLSDDGYISSQVYGEAYKVISSALNSSKLASSMATGAAVPPGPVTGTNKLIRLKDFSFLFPILSGLAIQYELQNLEDDEKHSRELAVSRMFLEAALSSPRYFVHGIVARYLRRNALAAIGQLVESAALIDPLLDIYDVSTHSPLIVKDYSSDTVLAWIAANAVTYLLLGDVAAAEYQADFVRERILHLTNISSLAMSVSATCYTLVLLKKYSEALELFQEFLRIHLGSTNFNVFGRYTALLTAWINIEVARNSSRCSTGIGDSNDSSEIDSKEEKGGATTGCCDMYQVNEELDRDIKMKKYLYTKRDRPKMNTYFESICHGVENICAEICIYQAFASSSRGSGTAVSDASLLQESDWNSRDAYLHLALDYVEAGLLCNRYNSMAFSSYMQSLLLKARIEVYLGEMTIEMKEQYFANAQTSLSLCYHIAKKLKCWFIVLCVADYFLVLHINIEMGKKLLIESATAMRELKDLFFLNIEDNNNYQNYNHNKNNKSWINLIPSVKYLYFRNGSFFVAWV